MRKFASAAILAAAASYGSPALASSSHGLDLPAGRLGDAVTALGRQAGVSVSVDDQTLWQHRVPAIKGSYSVQAAFKRLLAGTAAEAVRVGPDIWRVRISRRSMTRRAPAPVKPAEPAADEPETIIVTASKHDLSLHDYAGAASIIDGDDLSFGGPSGTEAILSRLATLSSTYLGAGRNKLFIRGIADSSFTGPTQATVGQYLGDIRLAYNAPDPDLRLYDMQSVEVLEGPQGTLYGAGSLGGIIRTLPNNPEIGITAGAIQAGVSATQHGAPSGDLAAVVNLPVISDRASLRLVGYGITEGGYIDNPFRLEHDINRTSIAGGRGTLRIDVADDWTIDLGVVLQKTHGDDSQYADKDGPALTRNSPLAAGFDARYRLGEMVVSKNWGDLHFTSSTGLVAQRLNERYDATASGGRPQLFQQNNHTRMLTSEARLWQPLDNRFGWVIGASYLRNDTLLTRTLGAPGAPAPVTGVNNHVSEFTVYGEASARLMPWLSVTAGGRMSRSSLSGAAQDPTPTIAAPDVLARAAIVATHPVTSYLPSLAVVVAPLPGLSLYARYQEGFRPGGLAIDGNFVRRFRNDHVATIEGGAALRHARPGPVRFFAGPVAYALARHSGRLP